MLQAQNTNVDPKWTSFALQNTGAHIKPKKYTWTKNMHQRGNKECSCHIWTMEAYKIDMKYFKIWETKKPQMA